MQRYGTRLDFEDKRLVRVVDRDGHTHATIAWKSDTIRRLTVPGAIVDGAVIEDALFGAAHAIFTEGNEPATTMSALDWVTPTEIPAIAAPGQLRHGAGGALINVIAQIAQAAGVTRLHYAGPYPSDALYDTLRRSFHTDATQEEFTASFFARAANLSRDPLPFSFVPDPHERIRINGGHVEMRDGLERAVIDGVVFSRGTDTTKRLLASVDAESNTEVVRAEVWFGNVSYAQVATFDTSGVLVDGPHAPPAYESSVIGKRFPKQLVDAIADLCAQCVPAPLAPAARAFVTAHPIVWADLGLHTAARTLDEIHVHAALWDHVLPLGLERLAMTIVDALVPVVTLGATAMLAAAQR
ncbi:MAG TPA: hypothetical protein VGM90_00915 [Kofleriaceae bacterium]|jgi:hypothetical protein